ncbi:MAG TPA: TetR/AcrR family transcriptional regulator [Oculatellaceae cyanobacterium]|jgi:AcrR family transcriptional regulator
MVRGRPRAFNKEAALDIALRLFWQHGYEGTSIAMLAKAMNIKIPSLYAAFGNKENLFKQAVNRYGELSIGIYQESFKQKTAYEVAKSVLKGEIDLVTNPDWPHGCLLLQSALAVSPESEPIRQMMTNMRRTAQDWLRVRFEQALQEGDLPSHINPATLAGYIMTLLAGLAAQARSGASRKELEETVQLALSHWPHT